VIAVADAHDAVWQFDDPSRDEGVASRWPKWRPLMVTLQPADDTKLLSAVKLTTGASKCFKNKDLYHIGGKAVRNQESQNNLQSKLKHAVRLPKTPETVMRSVGKTPSPMLSMQVTDDVEAQAAVPQLLTPIVDVGVVASAPKFRPDTVTL